MQGHPASVDCHENEVIGYDADDPGNPRSIACIPFELVEASQPGRGG